MEKPKRVALYSRCSTKIHSQEVESQLLSLREFCEQRNYNIVEEYIDYASGGTSERDDFQRMYEDARIGKFDCVVFYSLCRFSRGGATTTITLLEKLRSYNVDYVSLQEQFIDSAGIFKDSLVALLSSLNAQQRILQGERVKAGLKRAVLSGKVLGRKRIDQELIDKIYELSEQGLSNRAIGRKLDISYNTARRYLSKKEKIKTAA